MRKDTATRSAFDINLSRKYRALNAELERIIARQVELSKQRPWDKVKSEAIELITRREELIQAIFALVPFDVVAFNKYAAAMFQNMMNAIVNDAALADYAVNFSCLTLQQKEAFGKRLYQKLAQKYGEKNFSDLMFTTIESHDCGGYYDGDKTIYLNVRECKSLTAFITSFAHEFSHYVYYKIPRLSPLNAQTINIADKHYIMDNDVNAAKYKAQPMELPSFQLMDYFTDYDFVGKLATALAIKQNTLGRGRG